MVLWLHSEVAPACCVISGNVKEKERQRLSRSISKKQRDEIRQIEITSAFLLICNGRAVNANEKKSHQEGCKRVIQKAYS